MEGCWERRGEWGGEYEQSTLCTLCIEITKLI
jgi:hypothetical protein